MVQAFRHHLPIFITAVLTATVFAAGPTVARAAFDAVNSDKVDGKHAVGASATPANRAGKLVATNNRGRLPNNIIAKAPDANKVDGVDSSVLLNRYTKAQIDAMPFRRLLGVGTVASDGTLNSNTYFPGGTATRLGTGVYHLTLPGYGPNCARDFPIVATTPMWASGEVYTGGASMSCVSGDVHMQVNTTNSAGTGADRNFAFMFFAGDSQVPPAAARQRAAAEVCELTEGGVTCR